MNGVDKTNCLATESDTVIELDISKFKLPIKISFIFDTISYDDKPNNIPYSYKGNYQKDKNLIGFYNLRAIKANDPQKIRNENKFNGFSGIWTSMEIFLSSDHIDIWPYGERAALFFGNSVDDKKLYFNVIDNILIDNLIIESVDEKVLPDVSGYKSVADTIPFKKGQNEILLIKETPPLNLIKTSRAKSITIEIELLEHLLGLDNNQKTETKPLP